MNEKNTRNTQCLLNTQGVCDNIGYVEIGLLKCVLVSEEKEVIDDFVFEGQFVTNYYSFLTREKSSKEIVCMEDCILKVITRDKLEAIARENRFVEQIARQVAERLFISTHRKMESLRLQSAEERYLNLLKANGRILGKIPQYEIASYLNVSPETVSRIRRSLSTRS